MSDGENEVYYDDETAENGEDNPTGYGEEAAVEEEEDHWLLNLHLAYGAAALWNVTVGLLLWGFYSHRLT